MKQIDSPIRLVKFCIQADTHIHVQYHLESGASFHDHFVLLCRSALPFCYVIVVLLFFKHL